MLCNRFVKAFYVISFLAFYYKLVMLLPLQAQKLTLQACNSLVIDYKHEVLLQPL